MPVTGDVKAVDASQPGDSQVQVYAVAPREGAPPSEIVDGFLESMTSDDPAFATTRKYLSADARRTWQPGGGTTVLAQAPTRSGPLLHDGDNRATRDKATTYTLTGEKVAAVDAQSSYRPLAPTDYSQTLHLVLEKGADGKQEWRIDVVPDGLVLGQSDFKRLYRPVNKYYFATGRANGQSTLVADPVYVRNRTDPVTRMDTATQTVRTLLAGPTNWLRPVVDSRFPTGTALRKGVIALPQDDQNVLKVPLNDKADKASPSACRMMAAQVLFTLGDLTSARVERVELEGGEGRLLRAGRRRRTGILRRPRLRRGRQPVLHQRQGPGGADPRRHRRHRNAPARDRPARFGHRPDGLRRGGTGRATGRRGLLPRAAPLRVLPGDGGRTGRPLVSSKAKKAADRLSSPSWDGRGDLWVADRDPAGPRLLRLTGVRASRRRSGCRVSTAPGSRSCGCPRTGCGSLCC